MRLIYYLFLLAFLFVACEKEEDQASVSNFSEDYGEGLYIVTDQGISFYNDTLVVDHIFNLVNKMSVYNPNSIKFNGTKAYIIADNSILTANVFTFENKEQIFGFNNAVDLDFVSNNRLFVVDKGDSKVKVVDLETLDVTDVIEAGDSTKPCFIVSNSYRSYIMNGGGDPSEIKDSTIIAIDYKDNLIELADFIGNLIVGTNPNSAVLSGNLKILCQGVYDSVDISNNIEASFYNVNPNNISINFHEQLSNIYNADNLVANSANTDLYFTANGGIYRMPNNASQTNLILSIESDVLFIQEEQYVTGNSSLAWSDMLYINDAVNNPNIIYKYNINTSSYTDTIVVEGNVLDVKSY